MRISHDDDNVDKGLFFSACRTKKFLNANNDGAYIALPAETEEECIQQCMNRYPECVAVDFNIWPHSRVCAGHRLATGRNRKPNSCCNRYEIYCDDRK